MSYTITIGRDGLTKRYFILSSDIHGLTVETDTIDEFIESVREAAPRLIKGMKEVALNFQYEIAVAGAADEKYYVLSNQQTVERLRGSIADLNAGKGVERKPVSW